MGFFKIVVPLGIAAAGGVAVLTRQWRRKQLGGLLRHGAALQLAADGRMALTSVQHRDPQFDEEALLERCAEFQERFHAARTAGSFAGVCTAMLPGLRVAEEGSLAMQRALLRKLEVYDISVAQAIVLEAVDDGFFDTVYIRISGEAMQRTMHGATNRWLHGGTTAEPMEEVWGLSRRHGVPTRTTPGTLEGFCPQCGTDLQSLGAATACARCGTGLDDGSHDWVVSYHGTAAGWRPSDVPPPAAEAPEAALTRMADAVTGIFWRHRLAALNAEPDGLAGVATRAFLEEHATEFTGVRDAKRNFHASPAIGRIEWLGATDGHRWFRVHWHGLPVQARVPSFLQEDAIRQTPLVDDYVLEPCPEAESPWRLTAVHRVTGEVPCPEQLDSLDETKRLDRLPVVTAWERDILLQTCVALLLRTGPVAGRRLAHVVKAAEVLEVGAERVPSLLRQVESEGATLFGRECKLPPEMLLRHLARVAVACVAMPPELLPLLHDVASALGVLATLRDVLHTEQRLLTDAVRRIERAGRHR